MKLQRNLIERVFETTLFNVRFIVLIPVIFSIVASIIMYIKGSLLVVDGVYVFLEQFSGINSANQEKIETLVPLFITSVDIYLFATVLLIFSMGLYELFISKIDPASRTADSRPEWLNITNLDDLKGTIGKVILMILIVSFFEKSLDVEYKTALDLLYLSIGIILVSGALFLTHVKGKNGHK